MRALQHLQAKQCALQRYNICFSCYKTWTVRAPKGNSRWQFIAVGDSTSSVESALERGASPLFRLARLPRKRNAMFVAKACSAARIFSFAGLTQPCYLDVRLILNCIQMGGGGSCFTTLPLFHILKSFAVPVRSVMRNDSGVLRGDPRTAVS